MIIILIILFALVTFYAFVKGIDEENFWLVLGGIVTLFVAIILINIWKDIKPSEYTDVNNDKTTVIIDTKITEVAINDELYLSIKYKDSNDIIRFSAIPAYCTTVAKNDGNATLTKIGIKPNFGYYFWTFGLKGHQNYRYEISVP